MGNEALCKARVDGRETRGKALLEGDAVILRGDVRARVKMAEGVTVTAAAGWLKLVHPGGVLELDLGDDAEKWATRLKNPKRVVDKLGIKAGLRVAFVGAHVDTLVADVRGEGALVSIGAPRAAVDLIFFAAESQKQLVSLAKLKARLVPSGGIWVVRQKGSPLISERDVMEAGKLAGLVDVKVVKLSDAHTAEKFVIPVAKR